MNNMKNVIALGLIACAAFTSVSVEAKFITSDVNFWRASCADHNIAYGRYMIANPNTISHAKYDTSESAKQDAVWNKYVEGCAQFMSKWDLDVQPDADGMADGAFRGMSEYLEANIEWYIAETNAIVGAKPKATLKQQKVAQVAKQAQQVECSPSTGDNLIAQQKQAWSTYMQQRQAIRDMGQGAYTNSELNAIVNENTAELKMAAEMASDKAEHYFKVCE